MTISEQSRHQLHQRLEELLGPREAATLMEHLPPVGWADVATKRDLDHLSSEVRAELHQEIGGLRVELHQQIGGLHQQIATFAVQMRGQMQTLFLGLVGLQVTAVGLGVAVSRVL